MLIKFSREKLARFAVLMLFIFLLAQSGVARAQEETPDVQVAREILFEAARQMGYIWGRSRCVWHNQYYMGLALNAPVFCRSLSTTGGEAMDRRHSAGQNYGNDFHDHPG